MHHPGSVVQENAAMARAYELGTPLRVVFAKAMDKASDGRVYVYAGLYKIVECRKCALPSSLIPRPCLFAVCVW